MAFFCHIVIKIDLFIEPVKVFLLLIIIILVLFIFVKTYSITVYRLSGILKFHRYSLVTVLVNTALAI